MTRPGTDIAKVETRRSDGQGGAFPCPGCSAPIAITLEALLVRRTFACTVPGCRTVLQLDTASSKEALTVAKLFKAKVGP